MKKIASSSHTDLQLLENPGSSSSNLDLTAHPRSRVHMKIILDGKLLSLLGRYQGFVIDPALADCPFQVVRTLIRDVISSSGCETWTDTVFESESFQKLGGWRALTLKLHDIFARLLSPTVVDDATSRTITNEWETTSLVSKINNMHSNEKQVESFLNGLKAIDPAPHVSLLSGNHSPKKKTNFHVDIQMLWFSVQCCGRFDSQLLSWFSAQLPNPSDSSKQAAMAARQVFENAQYMQRVSVEKQEWYLLVLSQQGKGSEGLETVLADIAEDLKVGNLNIFDSSARKRIEKLLVLLLGNADCRVRCSAATLLNQLYDTHSWQSAAPLKVQVCVVGEPLEIPVNGVGMLELVAPVLGPDTLQREVMTLHAVKDTAHLACTVRCGFYDWRLSTDEGVSSGRFIVLPAETREMQLHRFQSNPPASAVQDAFNRGVTGVILPMCDLGYRCSPVDTALEVSRSLKSDQRWMVNMSLNVSLAKPHRKYKPYRLHCIDDRGAEVVASSDDQMVLNYRLAEVWDMLVSDVSAWSVERGAGGVFIEASESVPPVFAADMAELLRLDADGLPHFNGLEKASGSVIIPGRSGGGFAMTAAKMAKYPNPFLIKLARELWRLSPDFCLLVEAKTVSEVESLVLSGFIPIVTSRVSRQVFDFIESTSKPPGAVVGLNLVDSTALAICLPWLPVSEGVDGVDGEVRLRRLRKNDSIFRNGSFHPLNQSSDSLLAFARGSKSPRGLVLSVVAVNLDSHATLALSAPLSGLLAEQGDVLYYLEGDLLSAAAANAWTSEELRSGDLDLSVPPSSCIVHGFRIVIGCLSLKKQQLLLNGSLKRGGSYFSSELSKCLAGNTCDGIERLWRLCESADLGAWHRCCASDEEWVRLVAKLTRIGGTAKAAVDDNELGCIAFVTPEIGKWSTAGGLGVMVDELSLTFAERFSQDVIVISPYYDRNREGETGYLQRDGISYRCNVEVHLGRELVSVGIHEGFINGVTYYFLHNTKYFPSLYPQFTPSMMMGFLSLIGKGALEVLCFVKRYPKTILTNDWATGLTPAYAKNGFFGQAFTNTKFLHIVHNLDPNYEGRVFPNKSDDLGKIHCLPSTLLVDPLWTSVCVNPSRCAILSSDQWGTVSRSYKQELLAGSPLAPLLGRYPHPFAHPNGIPLTNRLSRLHATGCKSHEEAKAEIQKKYFGRSNPDLSIPLLAFIGRITQQKGVHLVLEIAEALLKRKPLHILLAGKGNPGDPYSDWCCDKINDLRRKHPTNFWADPQSFFKEGPLVNLGADFGLMPSMFEPGGIVQQEFFVACTPVIAFRTGGLKDTVFEFYQGKGNGFTFEAYSSGDFAFAIDRALKVYDDPDDYLKLRVNARESVITSEVVGAAWLTAVADLHGKILVDETRVQGLLSSLTHAKVNEVVSDDDVSSGSDFGDFLESEPSSPASLARSSLLRIASSASISSVVSGKRNVRVIYRHRHGNKPTSVLLSGSFDNWGSRTFMIWDERSHAFHVDMRLTPGDHRLKVIVDGNWMCMPDYPVARDESGNDNNLLSIN